MTGQRVNGVHGRENTTAGSTEIIGGRVGIFPFSIIGSCPLRIKLHKDAEVRFTDSLLCAVETPGSIFIAGESKESFFALTKETVGYRILYAIKIAFAGKAVPVCRQKEQSRSGNGKPRLQGAAFFCRHKSDNHR